MGVKVIVLGNVLKLHVFYFALVPSRRGGVNRNVKVSIFLKLWHYGISVLCYDVGVPDGNGEAFKGITDCQGD